MNDIVSRIYELLAHSGMKKKEFAEKIGVSRNTIQNWKNADSMPTLSVIERICEVFHVTVEQFFSGIGNPEVENSEREFLGAWRMLTEKEKSAVSVVLETFREARCSR